MSIEILCGGCGKVYPLWIDANAKPVNCSECGTQVEQRHVEQHAFKPQFSGGGGKVNSRWIVVGLSAMAFLMLVICGGVGGAYYYVTTQRAEAAREATDRALFDRARSGMADTMERWSQGRD